MPDEHQRGQRVIHHGLVVDRDELFADALGQRVETGTNASGEDYAFKWGGRAHGLGLVDSSSPGRRARLGAHRYEVEKRRKLGGPTQPRQLRRLRAFSTNVAEAAKSETRASANASASAAATHARACTRQTVKHGRRDDTGQAGGDGFQHLVLDTAGQVKRRGRHGGVPQEWADIRDRTRDSNGVVPREPSTRAVGWAPTSMRVASGLRASTLGQTWLSEPNRSIFVRAVVEHAAKDHLRKRVLGGIVGRNPSTSTPFGIATPA